MIVNGFLAFNITLASTLCTWINCENTHRKKIFYCTVEICNVFNNCSTHAVKGAILRARVRDTQKPAPPVANQNSDTFCRVMSSHLDEIFCRVIYLCTCIGADFYLKSHSNFFYPRAAV